MPIHPRYHQRFHRSLHALLLSGMLLGSVAQAARVQIPLAFDEGFLGALTRERVFTGPGASLRFNDDGSGCQFIVLRNPRVRLQSGSLVLQTAAEARAGRKVAGRCLLSVNWHGQLEFTQVPRVGSDRTSIELHTTSWRALKVDGSPDNLSTTIGRWLEQLLPAELKLTRISFEQPLAQLEEFMSLLVIPAATEARSLTDSIAIESVAVDAQNVRVALGLTVPDVVRPAVAPEPELSDRELEQLAEQLDGVDAFFSQTVKTIGQQMPGDPLLLLDVLLELRHDLLATLAERERPGVDPARRLFVHAWEQLTPVLEQLAGQQTDSSTALRYLTFLSAGDALKAIDDLGPAIGIEISTAGLRRLARILIPGTDSDPLSRGDTVDLELRKSLGFGDPIPLPVDDGTSWIGWLIPSAVAASTLDASAVKRLNAWIPKPQEMNAYLPMVRDVLAAVVAERLRSGVLEREYQQPYRWLVFTTAWQESCWRQFVAKDNMRVPMQSGTGDIGMMQINPKVWRGLYDLHGLRWDIVYNARAGADILEHHMLNYAIKNREHRTTGTLDSLARSTYAAYNGGPRQYNRYRRADASARDKKVDGLFFEKYRKLKAGQELAVSTCYSG